MSDGDHARSPSSSFHFVAGLGSGLLSAVLLQPADLLKTRVQQSRSASLIATLQEISKGPQPLQQLWRGTIPSALRTGFGSAVYFTTLNALRQGFSHSKLPPPRSDRDANPSVLRHSSSLPKLSNLANLSVGAIARTSAGFLMMPITVIKVRYESNLYAYRSLWAAGSDIITKEGPRGFFSGFGATAIRDAPYAGLYVLFYEQCKRRLSLFVQPSVAANQSQALGADGMRGSTSASINFLSGIIAAALATTITNPFDAIKTRIQLMPEEYTNMLKAGKKMIGQEGFRSLLDGLGLRMTRKALSSALAWTLYEELVRQGGKKWREPKEHVL
ncbi:solute carrier family 25 member 38 [Xylona heveae TC161]|uniref:Mitochondrial glycine transporter n=1 Tax=Xylona heveae (strain CBS 132557 / TC161) TaxID=1328760 RepID=A0A165JIW0_XYLHT|nr:solute carrier family 25 member 38 [Xylona heveae TC161]KZF26298.1 solute carrier family 25 member 38 [Xylona heveae TC161]